MKRKEGSDAHRHPDAVEYPEGPGGEGAAMVRPYEGGHTRYRVERGGVRSRDVAGDGTPEALPEAVPAESGPRLPRLAADLASGAPGPAGRGAAGGCLPPGRAPGLEGDTVTPGTAGAIAGTVPFMGFGAAHRTVANSSGSDASPGSPQRRPLAPGEAARRFGRGEVLGGSPPEPRMYPSIDGAGVPMHGEEAAGVAGRQADGTSRTGEARPAAIYTTGDRRGSPGTEAAKASPAPSTAPPRPPEARSPRPSRRAWTAGPGGAGRTAPAGPWPSPRGRGGYRTPATGSSAGAGSRSRPVSRTASSARRTP